MGFANRLARRMPRHNGYKTLNERATLAQLHPATARIAADEDGLMPDFVIYYALVATAKVFLNKVSSCTHLYTARLVRYLQTPSTLLS